MENIFLTKKIENNKEIKLPLYNNLIKDPNRINLDVYLEDTKKKIDLILNNLNDRSFSSILKISDLVDLVNTRWGILRHLHSVKDSKMIRNTYETILPKITDFYIKLNQDKRFYNLYKFVKSSKAYKFFNKVEQKIVLEDLTNFKLAGLHLSEQKKEKFQEVNKKIEKLEMKFSNNVLDDTNEYELFITDEKIVLGMPESVLGFAHEEAVFRKKIQRDEKGWVFTLQQNSYLSLIKYCRSRKIREKIYRAYVTRASKGKRNNTLLIEEILMLRKEKAKLIGYKTFSDMSLVKKMASSKEKIFRFLFKLAKKTKSMANKEKNDLIAFAKKQDVKIIVFEPWDFYYYSELLKKQYFSYSEEEIKVYFSLLKIIPSTFKLIERLFGYHFLLEKAEKWDEEVLFYAVVDKNKKKIGYLFLDLYARKNKRGGAWMDECLCRKRLGQDKLQLPIAYVVTNFLKSEKKKPTLLTHVDLLTFLHEMGHAIHHLFTKVDLVKVSGINGVPWDSVELPSQFLEYWGWQKESLRNLSEHYETKKKMPNELLNKILAGKYFQSGLLMLRQIEFSLIDLGLHSYFPSKKYKNVKDYIDSLRNKVAVLFPPEYSQFENSFLHIFSGGYAAGYYSYKWAEVLAADAFSLFEEKGIFDRKSAKAFLNEILEKGGSDDFMKMYKRFRKRGVKTKAFLRYSGILRK